MQQPGGRRSHADADCHGRSSVLPCPRGDAATAAAKPPRFRGVRATVDPLLRIGDRRAGATAAAKPPRFRGVRATVDPLLRIGGRRAGATAAAKPPRFRGVRATVDPLLRIDGLAHSNVLYGAHVSAAGGISKAVDRIAEIGGTCVQVFTQSPRMWKPTAHAEEQLARFRERRRQARVRHVSCHALYLVNLASSDAEVRAKSLDALRATMEVAGAIEADAVVFHVGSHLGYGFDEAIEAVVPPLRELLELTTHDLWLCLENAAGAGGTIGRSVAELDALFQALDAHPRLGICLDSCHWWASGVDVTDPDALDAALDDLDARIGVDRVRVLHVNDSKVPLGSNRDQHEVVAEGLIGKGLATFLGHPAFGDLPAVLETWPEGGLGSDDVERLRALRRRGMRRRRSR